MKSGDRIRYTMDNLGVIDPRNPYRFMDEIVNAGDEGTFDGIGYTDGKPWANTTPDGFPEGCYCPVDQGQFEVIPAAAPKRQRPKRKNDGPQGLKDMFRGI